MSCPVAGSCVAVGYYTDTSDRTAALVETEASGSWANPGLSAPEPANSGTDGDGYQDATLTSVACPTVDFCAAAGQYKDTSGFDYGLIDTYAFSAWQANQAPEPATSGTDGDTFQDASLSGVSCPTTATCVLVGNYNDTTGYEYPLVDQFVGTTWVLDPVSLPSDTGTDSDLLENALLTAAVVPVAGVLRGRRATTADSSGHFQGLLETLASGGWTPAEAPLPAGASAQPYTNLWGVSCDATLCAAVGSYFDGGARDGLLDVLTPPSTAPGPTPPGTPPSGPGPGSTSGGYDLVGSDGGVFVFPTGQSSGFFGSLPGLGVHVNDVVGIVPTDNFTGLLPGRLGRRGVRVPDRASSGSSGPCRAWGSTSTTSWASCPRRRTRATSWSAPTAACSPSATPRSRTRCRGWVST